MAGFSLSFSPRTGARGGGFGGVMGGGGGRRGSGEGNKGSKYPNTQCLI